MGVIKKQMNSQHTEDNYTAIEISNLHLTGVWYARHQPMVLQDQVRIRSTCTEATPSNSDASKDLKETPTTVKINCELVRAH